MQKIVIYLFIFLFFWNCDSKPKSHPIQFYHWQSNAEIDELERDYFEQLNSEKLYIRLFDVVQKSGKAEAVSSLQNLNKQSLNAQYIPVVYLVNEVFLNLDESSTQKLALNTYQLISQISEKYGIADFDEIQIDCDWTSRTKENYFLFLKELKKLSKVKISSTLRLHQLKFKSKTGIPPVDKVYLMCYATSSPIEEIEKNSILDISLLKDYMQSINEYPIDFDIALPIYSWGIVSNHLGKKMLINAVHESDLNNADFKKNESGFYIVQKDVFLKGIYLNQGFKIKLENISKSLLKESRAFLDAKIKTDFNIVYYHLDSQFLQNYSLENLR